MGTKTVLSQTGSDNPTWGANPPTGAIVQAVNHKQSSGTAIVQIQQIVTAYQFW